MEFYFNLFLAEGSAAAASKMWVVCKLQIYLELANCISTFEQPRHILRSSRQYGNLAPKHAAMQKKLTDVIYSFPFQLLVLHLRSNLLMLAVWIFLALILTGNIGQKFGLRYLFLSPEYLGEVGFMSFFFVGAGFTALVISWNLSVYLLSSYRFSFLASLSRPFTRFVFNNMVIPLSFMLLFLYCQIGFGIYHEFRGIGEVIWDSVGFLTGVATMLLAVSLYFNFTNKDIFSLLKRINPPATEGPGRDDLPILEDIKLSRNQWRVETYLTMNFKPRLVRSVAHYDPHLLLRVFRQNHTNALLVHLFTLVVLILLGALIDRPAFRIPTATSIFLLMSIIMALAGAIAYWFNKWRATALIVLLLLVNQATRFDFLYHKNKAYGLDYQVTPAVYSTDSLEAACNESRVGADKENTLEILENWKEKLCRPDNERPKMIFFCVSGGGLKAAAWAMEVLQHADSVSGGRFLDHTVLMSGASGGLMGTSYYRELVLRKKQGERIDLYSPQHVLDISKDMLNSISFTIVTNDLFLPWATFEAGGHRYKKDRGYIFEKALNENTHYRLDKTIGDYAEPEREVQIPMVFITPSIVNDGRRMVISAQPVSYMMVEPAGVAMPHSVEVDAVDFGWLFEKQGATNLEFTTALRMNATYPYVLPNVFLPSDPPIEVLDAGFRDNFGLKTATRFIHVFKDWILQNTSGVVVVVVRAFDRQREITSSKNRGIFENILNPLEIAFKVMSLQDYEHDNNLGFLYDLLGPEHFEIIRFTYHPSEELKDSPISFYLTQREREDLGKAIGGKESLKSLRRIEAVLE